MENFGQMNQNFFYNIKNLKGLKKNSLNML